MAATTPAASLTKRTAFNRETKSLIDALGGGVETMTPRSSRTARNSNPVSPVPSPARSRFRVPPTRRPRRDVDDRPTSFTSDHLIVASSSSLNNPPSVTSPLAVHDPASTSILTPLPIPLQSDLQASLAPSGSQPKRKRKVHKSSATTRKPGSDSSLSDLSDSDLHRPPAKKHSHSHLKLAFDTSIQQHDIPLTPSLPILQPIPSTSSDSVTLPLHQNTFDARQKTQRLILKPPVQKVLMVDSKTPSGSKLTPANPYPIPRLNLPPKSDSHHPSNLKGKGRAVAVPLLKVATSKRSAKSSSLRRSRSTSHTPRSRRLTELQRQENEQKRAKLLASLDEEEAMIRSSSHPLLIDLQTNLERGRLVKHRQAHLKHEALKTYFARQHHEQEQRIWSNWADEKVRLRSELLLKCQLQLARAPFEFVMSNDTSNLQAMFHLTPLSKPAAFVADAAHTISADSLALGLERQRIRNHATWFLPSASIEADLAELRASNQGNFSVALDDDGKPLTSTTMCSSRIVSTPSTQLKRNTNSTNETPTLSGSHTQHHHVSGLVEDSLHRQRNGADSSRTESCPASFSSPLAVSDGEGSQMPESELHLLQSKPTRAKAGRPRTRKPHTVPTPSSTYSASPSQSSSTPVRDGPSGPRRRSTRQQSKQLQHSQPSSSLDNQTALPAREQAQLNPALLQHPRVTSQTWTAPELTQASPQNPPRFSQTHSPSAVTDPSLTSPLSVPPHGPDVIYSHLVGHPQSKEASVSGPGPSSDQRYHYDPSIQLPFDPHNRVGAAPELNRSRSHPLLPPSSRSSHHDDPPSHPSRASSNHSSKVHRESPEAQTETGTRQPGSSHHQLSVYEAEERVQQASTSYAPSSGLVSSSPRQPMCWLSEPDQHQAQPRAPSKARGTLPPPPSASASSTKIKAGGGLMNYQPRTSSSLKVVAHTMD